MSLYLIKFFISFVLIDDIYFFSQYITFSVFLKLISFVFKIIIALFYFIKYKYLYVYNFLFAKKRKLISKKEFDKTSKDFTKYQLEKLKEECKKEKIEILLKFRNPPR